MTFLFRRAARRAQQVATARVAFDDSRDFMREQIPDEGAPSPGANFVAPRPSLVHRSRVDPSSLVDSLLTLGSISNDLDLVLRRRRVAWGAPQHSVRAVRTAPRVVASFSELNRLRLDPRTAVCLRRRSRREVLFAKRVAGGRGMRTYRRNAYSQWSCT